MLAEEHQTPGLIAVPGATRRAASRATSTFIGSLYAYHLAYGDVPHTWPERVVDTFWAALHSSATDHDSS